MSHYSRMRGTALAALIAIGGLGINGCATAQSDTGGTANVAPLASTTATPDIAAMPAAPLSASATSADQPTEAVTADEAKDSQGTVAELQQLMHGSELSELRTAYNGTYGAS